MQEAQRMYTVFVVAHSDTYLIRVSACTPHHAKQLAYAKASHIEPDLSKYKVRPKMVQKIIDKF